MRFFSILFVLFVFITVPTVRAEVVSRDIIQSCERAQSTADIMRCVKKRHDEAQKRLNKIFDQLLENERAQVDQGEYETPEDIPSTLRITHQNWITYRDYQCAWETSREPSESLKRIRELSCLAALTEQRANILRVALDRETPDVKNSAQYSSTPRWMNALGADQPNIFWRYHDHIRADLDCDGEQEEIMAGLSAALRDARKAEADRYLVKSVVAITENPATGRPKSNFFEFTVYPEGQDGQLCRSNVNLTVIDLPAAEGEAEDAKTCRVALQVNDGKCAPHIIRWNGTGYDHVPPAAAQ